MMDLMCPLWMMLRASGLSIKMQCRTSRMPTQTQIHQLVNMRERQRRRARGHSSMRLAVGLGLREKGGVGDGGNGGGGDLGVYFKKQGASAVICLLTLSHGGISV